MLIHDVILKEYGKPGSKALAQGNFTDFINHYQGRRVSANLKLSFGTPDIVEISDPGVDKLVDYYNTELTTTEQKRDFFLNVMSNDKRMIDLLNRLQIQFTIHKDQGKQPGLLERKQEDRKDPDRSTVTDPRTLMALRKSFAKYPTARSDIEAYMRDTIDQQAETDRDLEQQVATNQAQERNLERLQNIARRQSQQLTKLDQENNQQEKELQDLEKQLADISGQTTIAEPSPAAEPEAKPAAAAPVRTVGAAPVTAPGQVPAPAVAPKPGAGKAKAAKTATVAKSAVAPTSTAGDEVDIPGAIGKDNVIQVDFAKQQKQPAPVAREPEQLKLTGTEESKDLSRMRTLAGLPPI